jgi:hypothetical protein
MDAPDNIIDKIKKCLRLSKSDNAHEAAAALRQAHKLMEQYNISLATVKRTEIKTKAVKAGAKIRTPHWELSLVALCALVFDCRVMFAIGGSYSQWEFVGFGHKPELAIYTFQVLLRQIKKARKNFLDEIHSRYAVPKRHKEVMRYADIYCDAWVQGVAKPVNEYAGNQAEMEDLSEYIKTQTGGRKHIPINRADRHKRTPDADIEIATWGYVAGTQTQIHRAVNEAEQPLALEKV